MRRPALSDRQGRATFIGTPKGKNEFWDIYDRARGDDAWFTLMLRASETGILPQIELTDALKTIGADRYDQEFECSFEAAIIGAYYGKEMRELTEAGRIALDHAEAIFRTADDLADTLRETQRGRRALRVGALATLSRNFQMQFLRPLIGRPDVEVVLRSGSQAELLRGLESLALDVVLTNLAPARDAASPWLIHGIDDQPVSLIGTPKRLAGNASLAMLLSENPVIVPTEDSPVRAGFDRLCTRLDVSPTLAAEVDDMAMMRLLAREDIGLAVLPPIAVKNELSNGMLVEANHKLGLTESFHAVTIARKFPNPLLGTLLHNDH